MKLRGFSVDCDDDKYKKIMKEYAESKFGKIENKTYTYEFGETKVNVNVKYTEKPNKKKKKNKKK